MQNIRATITHDPVFVVDEETMVTPRRHALFARTSTSSTLPPRSSSITSSVGKTSLGRSSERDHYLSPNSVAESKLEQADGINANINNQHSFFSDLDESTSAPTKMCFPGNSSLLMWNALRQKKKVSSTDVASVGNASDTLISVGGGADETGMFSNITGSQHVSGRDLHESAKMYLNRRDYAKALEYFEAILSAQMQRFGPLHPSVGAAMHNVGVCRQRMQQPALAANLLAEAVLIRKQTLGESHLEVAVSLSKLGTAQASLRQYEQAFASIRQAIRISKQQLGYQHKTTAQMLCHLACFYFETGELYAAEFTFMEAYDIYRNVWSSLHHLHQQFPQFVAHDNTDQQQELTTTTADAAAAATAAATPREERDACMAQMTDTLCNIGSIQNRRKRYAEAIETFQTALDLQLGIMGCDHALVVATLDNLAFAYSKHKDYTSALSCYQKMFKAQTKESFTDACLGTFQKQIIMYEKLKRIPEALETVRDTLRLAKGMLPRQDKKILEIKSTEERLLAAEKKSKHKSTPVAI